jgi:dihydrolipoamide dehydrogenase
MKTMKTDVAIIGAGTAGLNARREADKAGKSWVLIESGPYGTTCARVGCMPSKLLIAAANAAYGVGHAEMFGVRVEPRAVTIDGPAVMKRVQTERDRFAGLTADATRRLPEERRLHGRARFVGPSTLEVDDHTRVEANAVVLATGSSPVIPPPFDRVRDEVTTTDTVFEMNDLPASLAVVGTGIIGLELGQAFHRLGVRVEFFNPFDDLGPFTDPSVSTCARQVLGSELTLHLKSEVRSVERVEGGFRLRFQTQEGNEAETTFERILVAAGRRPNLGDLDLPQAGLELDRKGLPSWNQWTTQCGDAPIFLAGDASGHRPLLHEASDEGRIAGANAARHPDVRSHVRREPLAIAFTEPQMALVGARFADLDPDEIAVGEVSYEDQGRARVVGENQGLVRIYGRRGSCSLVGAEMFGPAVEHTAHLLAWAVQQGMRAQTALSMPFYHPVVEEGIRTALRHLASELQVYGGCPPEDHGKSPGS